MFRLTNCARTNSNTWCETGDQTGWNVTAAERNGLNAYTRSTALDQSAKAWSETMANTGVFGHSPQVNELGETITISVAFGLTSGEANVVAKSIVDAFMNSSGHRQQLLRSSDTRQGAGIELASLGLFSEVYVTLHHT